jgi:hypothetical protein
MEAARRGASDPDLRVSKPLALSPSRSDISKTPTVFRNKAQGSPLFPNDKKPPRIWNNPPQPQNAETKKSQKERGTLG